MQIDVDLTRKQNLMEHFFELPITHNNQELILKARLATFAYTFKFYVIVNGQELIFERDDNGAFRVLTEADNSVEMIPAELIDKIILALEQVQSI